MEVKRCRNQGKTAAAPVFPELKTSGSSSAIAKGFGAALDDDGDGDDACFGCSFGFGFGMSMTGRPAAVRSCFHCSQRGPPPMSMSSVMIVDDHLPSTSSDCVEPSPMEQKANMNGYVEVDNALGRTKFQCQLRLPVVL